MYNFYKNFLYVTAQFYFGFWSVFSAQQLYEKFLYQMFNFTMTSMPIMWYATCDLEYEKDEETYLLKQEKKERDGDNKIQSKNATHIQ